MSRENMDIVRRIYDLNNEIGRTGADFVDPEEIAPDLWARLAHDVEWHERSELPDAKIYKGPEEVKEFSRKTQRVFAEVRWEPQEFIDLGGGVVVKTTVRGMGARQRSLMIGAVARPHARGRTRSAASYRKLAVSTAAPARRAR